jgi:carboxylate-amine ligase
MGTRVASSTSTYNEALERGGEVRGPYRPLFEAMERMGPGMMAERHARAEEKLREIGATFPLPDADGQGDRVLPVDWVPRLIPHDHWQKLSAGLLQRGKALNAWLVDLYNGHQDIVPEEVVGSSVYLRPYPLPEGSVPVHVYGPDVVHLGDGEYLVLEDNVRVPSGIAYSEAVRRAGLAVMKELYSPYRVNGIYAYYGMLRATLEAAAPGVDDPFVVVATGGPGDPAFFEHARIARECGLRLVTPDDLYVRGDEVLAKPEGRIVDVIYRRLDDGQLFSELPEIEALYRSGEVALANTPGVGVADDKAVFSYVPAMVERYLGEKPILESVHTLSLGDPGQLSEALEHLPELVIKPREGFGAKGVLVGPEADREAVERTRRAVEENPMGFVAQECLDFSTHVLDGGTQGEDEAFVDLRAFVLPAVDYVMPGGLTRVAPRGTRVVNSSAGGGFKDTWVLDADPEAD